jgi:hypothetical protein
MTGKKKNEIAPRATKNEIAPVSEGRVVDLELLDTLHTFEEDPLHEDCDRICHAAFNNYASKESIETAIVEVYELIADSYWQQLRARVEDATEDATRADVTSELVMLLAAFPGKEDLSAFIRIAIAEIAVIEPSRLVLAAACQKLRRKSKFRPALSEILALLSDDANLILLHNASLIEGVSHAPFVLRDRLSSGNYREAHWDHARRRNQRIEALRHSPEVKADEEANQRRAYIDVRHRDGCKTGPYGDNPCNCAPVITVTTSDGGVYEVDEDCRIHVRKKPFKERPDEPPYNPVV